MVNRIFAPIVMAACAVVLAVPAGATVHVVQQVNLTFSPSEITVVEGDTVRWVHGGQSHTVTSGTGAADPEVGDLFDAPLNAANPIFEYVFTTAGDVPYFCRPHELMGMDGMVHVEPGQGVGVEDAVLSAARLMAPYPNPFNPRTTIAFSLQTDAVVTLRVFSLDGRMVRDLHQGSLPAGDHRLAWNGSDDAGRPVAAGSYLVRLETPAGAQARTVTLVK